MADADAALRAALPTGMVGADAAAIASADATDRGGTGSGGTVPGGTACAEEASVSVGAPAEPAVDGTGAGGPGSGDEPAGGGGVGGAAARRMGVKTDGTDWPLPLSAGPPGPDPGQATEILGNGSVCASGSSLRPSTDGGRY